MKKSIKHFFSVNCPEVQVEVVQVPKDGNCFFHSVAALIPDYTADRLRGMVAQSVVACQTRLVEDACELWQAACQAKMSDFNFYAPFSEFKLPLTHDQLVRLSDVLNSSKYWGDHFALNVLSIALQVKFVVFSLSGNKCPEVTVVGKRGEALCLMLDQDIQHYSALKTSAKTQ